jgi:hypothetical protein
MIMNYVPAPPGNYQRNVTNADAWAQEHKTSLALVFEAFDETGEWPNVETLQRDLLRRGSDQDLVTELAGMPPAIGIVQPGGEVSLSARGLRAVDGAAPILDRFVAVIALAAERYQGPDEKPKITKEDLLKMGMDSRLSERVSALIFRESWPFGGGSGTADGSWDRDITLEIRHLINAETIDDYLAIQAQLRFGPPPALGASSREAPAPPPRDIPEPPLRRQSSRPLPATIFRQLVFKVLAALKEEHYFVEAFEEGEWVGMTSIGETIAVPPRIPDPEAWLMLNLATDGLWRYLERPQLLASSASAITPFEDQHLLLDTLELVYRDAVSQPVFDGEGEFEGAYDRRGGQRKMRQELNPILGRLDPRLEMRSDGEIAPKAATGLEDLADDPLSASPEGDDIRAKVTDAVRLFRSRDASPQDQLAALNQLAGVLERLKADRRLQQGIRGKDEDALFNIANNFGIRHDRPNQQRNYGESFREWIFHSYLAAIRLVVQLVERPQHFPS